MSYNNERVQINKEITKIPKNKKEGKYLSAVENIVAKKLREKICTSNNTNLHETSSSVESTSIIEHLI